MRAPGPKTLLKTGVVQLPQGVLPSKGRVFPGVTPRRIAVIVPCIRIGADFEQCRHNRSDSGLYTSRSVMRQGLAVVGSCFQIRAGQDRRKMGETCALLWAPAGGESADPPPVRGDAPPNRGATDPGGLTPDVD